MNGKIRGEIIACGTEITLGQMVDTNSAWLSEALGTAGIRVVRHTSVGDDLPRLVQAYQRAWAEHQVVVATGGLGPTEDDLARQAAAAAFGRELEYHEELAVELRRLFQRRGAVLTENNLRQAWLPRGALLVPNPTGTAPGFALADEERLMVFLPGVPFEMKRMVQDWLLPRLGRLSSGGEGEIKTVIMKVAGLGESLVDQMIGDLMAPELNPSVGLLASPDQIKVVVVAQGRSEEERHATLAPALAELEKRLAGHVFGYGEVTLPQAVAGLLKEKCLRLTIWDFVSHGRLAGKLLAWLDAANWRESRNFPGGCPAGPPADELNDGDIRLTLTARPDPDAENPADGQTAWLVESLVETGPPAAGQVSRREHRLGGEKQWARIRAASLAVFHLWQALTEG